MIIDKVRELLNEDKIGNLGHGNILELGTTNPLNDDVEQSQDKTIKFDYSMLSDRLTKGTIQYIKNADLVRMTSWYSKGSTEPYATHKIKLEIPKYGKPIYKFVNKKEAERFIKYIKSLNKIEEISGENIDPDRLGTTGFFTQQTKKGGSMNATRIVNGKKVEASKAVPRPAAPKAAAPKADKKPGKVAQVVELLKKNTPVDEIVKVTGCAKGTVYVQKSKLNRAAKK